MDVSGMFVAVRLIVSFVVLGDLHCVFWCAAPFLLMLHCWNRRANVGFALFSILSSVLSFPSFPSSR